jgi:hypothetical protein
MVPYLFHAGSEARPEVILFQNNFRQLTAVKPARFPYAGLA